MVLIKLLIGTGLYVGALVSNVYWLVKHMCLMRSRTGMA